MNRQDYISLFNSMHPNFFEQQHIRALPEGEIFSEMILLLGEFDGSIYNKPLDSTVSFGFFDGTLAELRNIVEKVEEDWPQFFDENSRTYCGYINGKIASFCNIDDMGEYNVNGRVLRVGGPGCVGTLPEYRDKGIGLTMVKHATRILKDEGFDLGYIHYTYVDKWYGKLGYKTVLQWGKDGFI